jgi:hypothetical protein
MAQQEYVAQVQQQLAQTTGTLMVPLLGQVAVQVDEEAKKKTKAEAKEKEIAYKKRCKEYMKFFHKVQRQVRKKAKGVSNEPRQ